MIFPSLMFSSSRRSSCGQEQQEKHSKPLASAAIAAAMAAAMAAAVAAAITAAIAGRPGKFVH